MKHSLPLVYLFLVITLSASSFGAEPANKSKDDEVLNNAAVIELNELALGDDLIVEKIRVSKCNFDTSMAGLKELHAAQISKPVMMAILATQKPKSSSLPTVSANSSEGDNPEAPHEAGIWMRKERDGKVYMTKLEPSLYSQTRSGPTFFPQFGEVSKSESVLRSAHASIQTTNHHLVFYFYFEKTQSGLSDPGVVATSPNEYILAQFDVQEKDNRRKLVMAQSGAYSGTEIGPDSKAVRSFDIEKLSPGAYKVTTRDDLSSGEFGFFFAGNHMGGKVFDFGVSGPTDHDPTVSSRDATSSGKTNWINTIFHKRKS
jgi:hypothetical protein